MVGSQCLKIRRWKQAVEIIQISSQIFTVTQTSVYKTLKQFTLRKCIDKEFCCDQPLKTGLSVSLLRIGYFIHRNYNVKYENNGNLTEVNASGSVPLALTTTSCLLETYLLYFEKTTIPPNILRLSTCDARLHTLYQTQES